MEFFLDYEGTSESAALIPEEKLLAWLFSRQDFKAMLFSQLQINSTCKPFLSVKEPIIKKKYRTTDEIDVILFDPLIPEDAIATECKRVKVTAFLEGGEKINKLEGLEKGIQQANSLLKKGFHQTYLMILVVTDGRGKKSKYPTWRSAELETIDKVYEFGALDSLHKDIGVIFCQVTQPTAKSIYENGYIHVSVDRLANYWEQDDDLTEKLIEYNKLQNH